MEPALLETPRQLAKRAGLSERIVRSLIQRGELEHIPIGRRVFIPAGAFETFVTEGTVRRWVEEIKVHASDGSKNVGATTSSGPRMDAAASAALVRLIAKKLKSCSLSSSSSEREELARVIPLKSL